MFARRRRIRLTDRAAVRLGAQGVTMKNELRQILTECADLSRPVDTLSDQADLYEAGLSSLTTVHLLMAIEARFDVVIPDEMLNRSLFQSIDTLAAHIGSLRKRQAEHRTEIRFSGDEVA
jgi:acyl carrier protein